MLDGAVCGVAGVVRPAGAATHGWRMPAPLLHGAAWLLPRRARSCSRAHASSHGALVRCLNLMQAGGRVQGGHQGGGRAVPRVVLRGVLLAPRHVEGVRRSASMHIAAGPVRCAVPAARPACAGRAPHLAFSCCCLARPVSTPTFLPRRPSIQGAARPCRIHVLLTSAACAPPCLCLQRRNKSKEERIQAQREALEGKGAEGAATGMKGGCNWEGRGLQLGWWGLQLGWQWRRIPQVRETAARVGDGATSETHSTTQVVPAPAGRKLGHRTMHRLLAACDGPASRPCPPPPLQATASTARRAPTSGSASSPW